MFKDFAKEIHQAGMHLLDGRSSVKEVIRHWAALGLSLALMLCLGCGDDEGANQSGDNNFARVEVEAEAARLGTIQTTIHVTGTVKAAQEAKIGTKVSGRVEVVEVDEGDRVKEGDSLVVLEQIDFELSVREAEAASKNARAAVSVSKVSSQKAKSDFERYVKLSKQEVISEQQFEDVDTAKRVAEENLKLARTGLAQAQARLESARQRLSDSVIRAPFDGVVVGKMTNEGEFVGAGSPPLVWLMDLSSIKIDVGVPEEHSGKVSVGQDAKVSVDAFPDMTFVGKAITVNPRVDVSSRSFNVQIEAKNSDPDHFLNWGMFARIALITGQKPDAVIVPDKALVTVEGKRLLYVVENSIARQREIEVGASDNGNVEILSGVKPGELVIVEGNWALSDGQEVIIIQTRGAKP